ncbi:hypothetical protein ACFLX1_00520 [Chloroflexota bacterium]
MDEAEVTQRVSPEIKRTAMQKARRRAQAARWDLDVAVFFFAVLMIVIILLFQGIGIEVVAPAAIFGLAMGWLMGWKKAKQLYQQFYQEELSILETAQKKEGRGNDRREGSEGTARKVATARLI